MNAHGWLQLLLSWMSRLCFRCWTWVRPLSAVDPIWVPLWLLFPQVVRKKMGFDHHFFRSMVKIDGVFCEFMSFWEMMSGVNCPMWMTQVFALVFSVFLDQKFTQLDQKERSRKEKPLTCSDSEMVNCYCINQSSWHLIDCSNLVCFLCFLCVFVMVLITTVLTLFCIVLLYLLLDIGFLWYVMTLDGNLRWYSVDIVRQKFASGAEVCMNGQALEWQCAERNMDTGVSCQKKVVHFFQGQTEDCTTMSNEGCLLMRSTSNESIERCLLSFAKIVAYCCSMLFPFRKMPPYRSHKFLSHDLSWWIQPRPFKDVENLESCKKWRSAFVSSCFFFFFFFAHDTHLQLAFQRLSVCCKAWGFPLRLTAQIALWSKTNQYKNKSTWKYMKVLDIAE